MLSVTTAEPGATHSADAPEKVTATPATHPVSIAITIAQPGQAQPATATTIHASNGPAKTPKMICESSNKVPSDATTPAAAVAAMPTINE